MTPIEASQWNVRVNKYNFTRRGWISYWIAWAEEIHERKYQLFKVSSNSYYSKTYSLLRNTVSEEHLWRELTAGSFVFPSAWDLLPSFVSAPPASADLLTMIIVIIMQYLTKLWNNINSRRELLGWNFAKILWLKVNNEISWNIVSTIWIINFIIL